MLCGRLNATGDKIDGKPVFADKIDLTLKHLWAEVANFAEIKSQYDEQALYGVTNGKAVGTYFEHKFTSHLHGALSVRRG